MRKRLNIAGSQIAKLRARHKPPLTQLEQARRVQKLGSGLDRAAIAKIERNLRYVADFELVAIARALKVSPMRLIQRARPSGSR
jgi:hypothetical protein